MGLAFDVDWWDSVLNGIHKASICARLTLIQFKVVFRCHYSKTRLSQIFPNAIDVCDRCSGSPCYLAHMFFFCPTLGNIWQTYFDTMFKVLLKTIDISPHVAIFGTPQEYHRFSSVQLEVLAFTSLIVRRHLLLNWKATNAPSNTLWITDVMSFLKLEKIRYSKHGNLANSTISGNHLCNFFKLQHAPFFKFFLFQFILFY